MMGKESVSSKGVAPGRSTTLQWVDPHALVFGQHKHSELKGGVREEDMKLEGTSGCP